MKEEKRHLDPGSAVIAAGMLVLIVYGSLYRFNFRHVSNPAGPFRALLATWPILTRPSDILANILFYLPFGFFIGRSLLRTRWSATIALATAAGALLSFFMESMQSYVVGRHSAMADVYADTLGTLLGAAVGCLSRGLTRPMARTFHGHFAMLLLVCWWCNRLYPYVPVIDLHKYWDALKPLVFSPALSGVDFYRHTVTWLAVGLLLDSLLGATRGRVALALLLPATLFARILIAEIRLSPNEVAGGLAGLLLWITWLSRVRSGTTIVAVLFITGIVLQGLEPFYLARTPRPFGWIPFRSFMQGSMEIAVVSFLEKVFTYGSLVWLLTRTGFPWARATLSGAALVFAIRLIQVYLPGRSAEITDVIMLLIMAGIMRLMPESEHQTWCPSFHPYIDA